MNLVEQFDDIGLYELPEQVDDKKKESRLDRALHIVKEHKKRLYLKAVPIIIKTGKNTYGIASFTSKTSSELTFVNGNWQCDCPDARIRSQGCKHKLALTICLVQHIHIPTIDEAMEMKY